MASTPAVDGHGDELLLAPGNPIPLSEEAGGLAVVNGGTLSERSHGSSSTTGGTALLGDSIDSTKPSRSRLLKIDVRI